MLSSPLYNAKQQQWEEKEEEEDGEGEGEEEKSTESAWKVPNKLWLYGI